MNPTKDEIIEDLANALKYLLAQNDDPSTDGIYTREAINNAYETLEAYGYKCEWINYQTGY